MGQVLQLHRSDRQVAPRRVATTELRDAVIAALPGTLSEVARKLGRKPTDGSTRRALERLVAEGAAIRDRKVYELAPAPVVPEGDEEQPGEPVAVAHGQETALPPVEPPEGFEGYEFPAYLDREAQQLLVVKLDEYQRIEWTSSNIELLEAYVHNLQIARECRDEVKSEGRVLERATGSKYKHPSIGIGRDAERDAASYRETLEQRDQKGGGDPASDTSNAPQSLF